MALHDFNWKSAAQKKSPYHVLEEPILKAKQIIFDAANSVPMSSDKLVRYEGLASYHDRLRMGIQLALVSLVGEFDRRLCRLFRNLWMRHRISLHDWIHNQYPRVGTPEGAYTRKKRRKGDKTKTDLEPALTVPIDAVWKVRAKRTSVEQYFEYEIHNKWKKKSPLEKLEALERILGTVPPIARSRAKEAIDKRNEFCHPTDSDWPRTEDPQAAARIRPPQPPALLDHSVFERCARGLDQALLFLEHKMSTVVGRRISTNLATLNFLLSERQEATFYVVTPSRSGTALQNVLSVIDGSKRRRQRLPEVLILGTTQEVAKHLPEIRRFRRRHAKLPIVFYEHGFSDGARGVGLVQIEQFAHRAKRAVYIPSTPLYVSVTHRSSCSLSKLARWNKKYPHRPIVIPAHRVISICGQAHLDRINDFVQELAKKKSKSPKARYANFIVQSKPITNSLSYDGTLALREAVAEFTRVS